MHIYEMKFAMLPATRNTSAHAESGGGPPHSKTLRAHEADGIRASVLECASPLALFFGPATH